MWTVKNISTEKKTYKYQGPGSAFATAISLDGELVINMAEGIENNDDEFQSILCEDCGYYHCAIGNWVAIRRFGDNYFLIPAFQLILEDEYPLCRECDPPKYITDKGAIWMNSSKFNDFIQYVPALKNKKNFKVLSKQEAIFLYKWDNAHQMFGNILELNKLQKERIKSVNIGEVSKMISLLETRLIEIEENNKFNVIPITENDLIISFYLRDKIFTEWRALVEHNGSVELLIGGQFILKVG